MVIWFVSIGLTGLPFILQNPAVLKAVSPYYALHFGLAHYQMAFITLGAVFFA